MVSPWEVMTQWAGFGVVYIWNSLQPENIGHLIQSQCDVPRELQTVNPSITSILTAPAERLAKLGPFLNEKEEVKTWEKTFYDADFSRQDECLCSKQTALHPVSYYSG